jgi:MFS family permease
MSAQPSSASAAIAAAIVLIGVVGVGLSLSLPLLSVEMERMGVSGRANGLSTAIAGLASILIAPRVPALAARFGVGRLIAAALVVCATTLVAFKATMEFWTWLPLRFAYSAGLATLFVLSEFWIASAAPPARRGVIMGVYATVLSLGFAAGPTLLALVGTTGWTPYLAGVVLFALAGLTLLLARTHIPVIAPGQRHAIAGYLWAAPLAATAGFASGAIETGAISLLPVLGLRLGFEASSAALLVSAMALGNVVSQVPIGWLSDKMDRRIVLTGLAIGAIAASVWLALAAAPESTRLFAILMLWGGLVGGFYTVGLAHLATRFPPENLVGANAAFVVMFNVGLLAGPPTIGTALDASTRNGFSVATSIFCLLVCLAAWTEARRRSTSTS